MKKLLLFPALLFAGISSHAQITIMPEAGINFSNLTSKWSISGADQTKSYTMQPGFRAGASVHIKFAPHLGIQPGIYFDYSSCKTENTVLGVTTRFTTQLSAIQVPVYLTFYSNNAINGGFFAGVGPFVNYYLSGKTKTKVSSGIGAASPEDQKIHLGNEDYKDDMLPFNFGGSITAGYILSSGLAIRAYFNLGLANVAPGWQRSAHIIQSIKSRSVGLSIGYNF